MFELIRLIFLILKINPGKGNFNGIHYSQHNCPKQLIQVSNAAHGFGEVQKGALVTALVFEDEVFGAALEKEIDERTGCSKDNSQYNRRPIPICTK
jgi:hypothetical protein